mmetsp:Transcript_53213/g.142338  ORF Transcript_53213/g.142338 Transcript_53213/m.142338 type:complete len:100 (-) Transcript_53213:438-737(-)
MHAVVASETQRAVFGAFSCSHPFRAHVRGAEALDYNLLSPPRYPDDEAASLTCSLLACGLVLVSRCTEETQVVLRLHLGVESLYAVVVMLLLLRSTSGH